MAICIFEDNTISTLLPLAHCQPAFELRCGIFTARERIQNYFPHAPVFLLVRDYLKDVVRERYPDCAVNSAPDEQTIFINGRWLMDSASAEKMASQVGTDTVFLHREKIVAISGSAQVAKKIWNEIADHASMQHLDSFIQVQIGGTFISYPWDLIKENPSMLVHDAERFLKSGKDASRKTFTHVHAVRPEQIFIGEECILQPGVVLQAEDGPVIIDDHATIMANSVINGPAYIGRKSTIRAGAKIYGNTSVGPHCKVGGEVEGSIIHSYANKQHDGFLGHSYLASWTNLGADTNTSDLKNTYGEIRMTLEGREVGTGEMFLGLIMADHAKCGINTMFNTGTCAGVGCNVFGGDYPPKYIPSFSWGGSKEMKEYHFKKFIAVARVVMERRNCRCTEAEETMLKYLFNSTSAQRRSMESSEV